MADVVEEPRIFHPGDPFLHSPYIVERFVGAGASGQVYAVRHRFTGDRRAVKVTHLADRLHARRVARSLFEAQASYCIRHGNVVQVIDLACEDDGMVWQLMELLDGHPVGALLGRYGRFSPVYAIDVTVEAAFGLQAAHEMDIVHRDVQPSNVFVTTGGRVKVLDFSLSKWVASPLKTTTGQRPKGTLGYMAPEHIKGAAPTPQFDVYALGVLLWQMLVGRHPFAESLGNTYRLVDAQMSGEPASLVTAAGLPAYCDDVIRAAVAKDPRARYSGMWPFAQALATLRATLLADEGVAMRVRFPDAWERQLPIVAGTASTLRYEPPRSLPPGGPAPHVPSARVVVALGAQPAPAAEERPKVAATVPMEAVPAAVGESAPARPPWIDRTPPAVAAARTVPTAQRRAPSRWIWAAVGVPAAIGVGAVTWALGGSTVTGGAAAPLPARPPSLTTTSPRAPSPSASAPPASPPRLALPPAEPRRGAPSRPRR